MWIFEEELDLLESELNERQLEWIDEWADYIIREEEDE